MARGKHPIKLILKVKKVVSNTLKLLNEPCGSSIYQFASKAIGVLSNSLNQMESSIK